MKKLIKVLKYLVFAGLAVGLVSFLSVLYVSMAKPAIPKSDAVIVLGAAVYTPSLYNRSLEGLKVYKEGKVSVVVLSGGRTSPKRISEAEYMKQVIDANASSTVPEILESESKSTYENFRNAREKIPNAKSIVIVSDCFHLARAVLVAKHFGFETVSWSCPAPTYYPKLELAFHYLRETAGLIVYAFKLPFQK